MGFLRVRVEVNCPGAQSGRRLNLTMARNEINFEKGRPVSVETFIFVQFCIIPSLSVKLLAKMPFRNSQWYGEVSTRIAYKNRTRNNHRN